MPDTMNNFCYTNMDDVPEFLLIQVCEHLGVEITEVELKDLNKALNELYPHTVEEWIWQDSGLDTFI